MQKIDNFLIFYYDDLLNFRENKNIADISIYDFKCDRESLEKSSYIFYEDQNGFLKVLKNRYPIRINNQIVS